jgi:hypothetical protein
MDIIKQKRFTTWVIVLLILLNVTTIALLWIGRPPRRAGDGQPHQKERDPARLQQLLKEELGFDKAQTEQFLQSRRLHMEQVAQLEDQVRLLKKQMFDKVLGDNPQPIFSDSLLKLTQEKQADIEQLTFQYLLNLKKICTPEQQKKLQSLMRDMLPPPNAPPGGGRPAPPPDGERPPHRPPGNE